MNSSETNNLITILIAVIAPYAAKIGLGASDLTALATALVPIGWAIYSHWDMKKVPENATVVTK